MQGIISFIYYTICPSGFYKLSAVSYSYSYIKVSGTGSMFSLHHEKYAVGATSGGYGRIPTRGSCRVNQWWWKQCNIRQHQGRAVPEAGQRRLSRRFFQLVARQVLSSHATSASVSSSAAMQPSSHRNLKSSFKIPV